MQNTDFFDIAILLSFVLLRLYLTKLIIADGELHFQSVVHILGARDPIRNFTDEIFLGDGIHRSAQGDSAIHGDDLHVPGIHGHILDSEDGLANLCRGVDVGLAVALIERRQCPVIAIANIQRRVIRCC